GTLIVTTGEGVDTITLAKSGSNAVLARDGAVTTYPLDNVASLDLQSGAGNDSIDCSLDIPASIVSGDGDDTITTAGGNDTIESDAGSDSISSGGGNDGIDAGD